MCIVSELYEVSFPFFSWCFVFFLFGRVARFFYADLMQSWDPIGFPVTGSLPLSSHWKSAFILDFILLSFVPLFIVPDIRKPSNFEPCWMTHNLVAIKYSLYYCAPPVTGTPVGSRTVMRNAISTWNSLTTISMGLHELCLI